MLKNLKQTDLTRGITEVSVGEEYLFFCLECRVLRINLERKRLHLTSKPILVKEEFTVVDSYESAKVGTVTEVRLALFRSFKTGTF